MARAAGRRGGWAAGQRGSGAAGSGAAGQRGGGAAGQRDSGPAGRRAAAAGLQWGVGVTSLIAIGLGSVSSCAKCLYQTSKQGSVLATALI